MARMPALVMVSASRRSSRTYLAPPSLAFWTASTRCLLAVRVEPSAEVEDGDVRPGLRYFGGHFEICTHGWLLFWIVDFRFEEQEALNTKGTKYTRAEQELNTKEKELNKGKEMFLGRGHDELFYELVYEPLMGYLALAM